MDQLALRRQRDESLMGRFQSFASLGHKFPLRGGGQSHAKVGLHFFHAVVRHPAAKTQIAQHGADLGIIFAAPRLRGSRRTEELPAEIAAQFFQFIVCCHQEGLGGNPHQLARLFMHIQLAFLAGGTGISGTESRVGNLHLFGSRVACRGRATVAFALGRGPGRRRARRPGWRRPRKKRFGFFGFSSEHQPLQPSNGGLFGFD